MNDNNISKIDKQEVISVIGGFPTLLLSILSGNNIKDCKGIVFVNHTQCNRVHSEVYLLFLLNLLKLGIIDLCKFMCVTYLQWVAHKGHL